MKRFLVLISFIAVALQASAQFSKTQEDALRKLQMAQVAISSIYVDEVDDNKLAEDAIRGMLEKLDPHSSYTTPKETKQFTEPLNGSFEGIGVQFNMVEDTLMVIQPVTNGPSEKVGIIAGDRIVGVNDTVIAGVKMQKEEIMRRLRGPKGTVARLKIVRQGIRDTLRFDVVRDKIPVHSIDATYMIRPTVGYIRVGSFGATTYKEFIESMDTLRQQGMEYLILDLQENGGGYLQAAAEMAGEFLSQGDMIVYTQGRRVPRQEFRAPVNGRFSEGRVVVLVDQFSASAAEIVTGALQDHDRATVVGRRTFGKGLVQRPIDLPDGSMIRLTVAHYYTPSGRCIQKPYEKGNKQGYDQDLMDRLNRGELTNADSIHFADSLKFQTLKEHRTVYGGGGITPDVFVPLDTTRYTRFHRELAAKGIVIQQNLRYVDQHRKELHKAYTDFDAYKRDFDVPQELIDKILAEGEKQNVKPRDDQERDKTMPYLKLQLKALIARDLWDMNEYFAIFNEENDIVRRGLQVLGF